MIVRRTFFRQRLIMVVMACLGLLLAGMADAQHASAAPISLKGISLTPAIESLVLQKGQTAANFTILVTNNNKNSVTLNISSVDFKSLNSSGGLAFIGSNASQIDHKYGLASWLDMPAAIELKPNQTKRVPMTVENRADLSPGGHYAAVLFQANGNQSGGNHVVFNQVVSTLVFVRKVDGERYGMSLAKPSLGVSLFHVPTNIDLFFKNTGNVQTAPRGLVIITSPLSRQVDKGIINTDSSLVLPESTRLVRTALFNTGSAWLPGRYHIRIAYHYDGSSVVRFYDSSFIYLNLISVASGLAILAIIRYAIRKTRQLYRKRRHKRRPKPPAAGHSAPSKQPGKRIKVQID